MSTDINADLNSQRMRRSDLNSKTQTNKFIDFESLEAIDSRTRESSSTNHRTHCEAH